MVELGTRKLIVDKGGRTLFECPYCHGSRSIDLSNFRGVDGPLNVKCFCGMVVPVSLEWRRTDRQSTYLEGYFADAHADWAKMLVKNISPLGIGFAPLAGHHVKEGDQISVTLTMSNGHQFTVQKDATVRFVKDSYLGCEFSTPLQYDEAEPLGVVS